MSRSTLAGTLLIAFALMATACGANPSAGSVAPTSASVARATDVPAAPTSAPQQTAATSVPTTAPVAAAPNSPYAGIDQGRTPEGYQMLGKANAPVTLVMYSDFF